MGWLFMHSMGVHKTPRDHLDAQFTTNMPELTRTVLRSAVVRMRTYYAALEIRRPDKPQEVVAIVCLVKYNPRDREGYIFGYKDMDETMGPCEAECPTAILDLLTPTNSEYAEDWRERCRTFHNKRKAYRPLRHGDQILFPAPIPFADGTSHRRFEVVISAHRPRTVVLRALNGGHYRISRLRDRDFEIEAAPS